MDDVIGIILLIVTIIVSLPVVGMMLLFAIFMDYGVEDKKENLKNIKKKDWKNEEREAYKKQLGY